MSGVYASSPPLTIYHVGVVGQDLGGHTGGANGGRNCFSTTHGRGWCYGSGMFVRIYHGWH